ncbi:MAG: hypothetical protein ACMX3H_18260 [Sodalis sp. (in: enterobacteria)]|uniref:hypothetical protein n=1 Tax=Sodalis sp. (in: enterobacteria) TaxID=1898979 RepID=UPI0039E3453E
MHYLAGIAQGNLGQSIFLNIPVTEALYQCAEPTFFLTLFALVIASYITLPIGVLSGKRPVEDVLNYWWVCCMRQ